MLETRFGRVGRLVPNPIDLEVWAPSLEPATTGIEEIDRQDQPYALWIGRAEGVHKRPQRLVELAALCPDIPFVMVMNPADREIERRVRERCPLNVSIVKRVAPEVMPAVFQKAGSLVNTSSTEGFPNTFLQAAAMGKPIYSLAVLGRFLVENGLGRAFEDRIESMAEAVRSASVSTGSCSKAAPVCEYDAMAARRFVQEHHGLEIVVQKFAEELSSLGP